MLLTLLLLLLPGCDEGQITRNPDKPIITQQNSIEDWESAAQILSDELHASGGLKIPPGKTVVIGVSPFRNDTTDPDLPVQLLFNKVCAALTKDNVQAMAFDPAAIQAARGKALARWEEEDKAAVLNGTPRPSRPVFGPDPDYTIDGDVTELNGSGGDRTHIRTFDFHLRLNDTLSGTIPWQNSMHVTKEWKRALLGG
jgi:hypothetical protein